MAEGLYLDSMTRACHRYVQSQLGGIRREGTQGAEAFRQKIDQASNVDRTTGKTVSEMTREEYKRYIYDRIAALPVDPSQQMSSVSVHISEAGFEAMQKDPEYEKWVLDTLRANFAFHDPWAAVCGGSFSVHRFGATKEEYQGQGWYMGFQGGKGSALFDEEAEEGFWERRARRNKEYLEQQQESAIREKRAQRAYQEAAIRRGDYRDAFGGQELAGTLNLAALLLNTTEKKGV